MKAGATLEQGLEQLAIELPVEARHRMLQFADLLLKWNRTYNLTAIRDPLAIVTHHLLDSLAVLPHLPMTETGGTLADAGSGAGFPGIPLAIARPQWSVSLAEANQKKAAFLRQAVIELRLANVDVYEGRVEAWRPSQLFSVVISRAFSELAAFIEACRHLVAADGVLAAMKGTFPRTELAGTAHCKCMTIELQVPFLEAERHLVLCRQD